LTGIASAAMSTTDSLLLMSGSAVAHDIMRKCLHEPHGVVHDEGYYLRVSRTSIVITGAIAFVCAIPDVALLLRIVSFAVAILGSCFFFPLVVGMNCRRVSREAALASSIGGVVATVCWIWCSLKGLSWATSVHPGVPGLVVSGVLMLVVSLITRPVRRAALIKYFPEPAR
jgi:Na+/proline symporter